MSDAFARYCEEVLRFRRVLNLTAARSRDALMEQLIEPSLALLAYLPECGRLLDVGSGVGIPGIPLLIARAEFEGVLVERRKKRAEFLRHIVRTLGLTATVYDQDIRDLEPMETDVCLARAVADQATMLGMVLPHVRMGGYAVLPTAWGARPVTEPGWRLVREGNIQVGRVKQAVFMYQREGVSRET